MAEWLHICTAWLGWHSAQSVHSNKLSCSIHDEQNVAQSSSPSYIGFGTLSGSTEDRIDCLFTYATLSGSFAGHIIKGMAQHAPKHAGSHPSIAPHRQHRNSRTQILRSIWRGGVCGDHPSEVRIPNAVENDTWSDPESATGG